MLAQKALYMRPRYQSFKLTFRLYLVIREMLKYAHSNPFVET